MVTAVVDVSVSLYKSACLPGRDCDGESTAARVPEIVCPRLIGTGGEPTVSRTPVARESLPLVPAILTRKIPSLALAVALNVRVDEAVAAAMKEELNAAVTPVGRPNAARLTPARDEAVTVKLADPFRSNFCAAG